MISQPYRVVVCDKDPVVSGALAYVLGVAFNTPPIARQFPAGIRVEILGNFCLDSILSALTKDEKFSANAFNHQSDFTGVLSVVTVNGLTDDPEDRACVARAGIPVVNLARLQGEGREWTASDANDTPAGSDIFYVGSATEALRISEACRTFASDFIGLTKPGNGVT